ASDGFLREKHGLMHIRHGLIKDYKIKFLVWWKIVKIMYY
ncbi:unnamed protein product, partial [marine sediment metagenome]